MINFFRRIRHGLLSESKVSKYLLYALGEIVLVVIGILIALSINNWKEQRKINGEELYYLKSLRVSIAQDTAVFGFRLTDIDRTLALIDSVSFRLHEPRDEAIQAGQLPRLYMSTFNVTPETTVIDDLKSTGKLSVIKNKALTDSLLTYYNSIESTKESLNSSLRTYARESIGPYLMSNYAVLFNNDTISAQVLKKHPLTIEQLSNDRFLVNALGYRRSILTGLRAQYSYIDRLAKNILSLISTEIDNKEDTQ
jgi:hypothetical protein